MVSSSTKRKQCKLETCSCIRSKFKPLIHIYIYHKVYKDKRLHIYDIGIYIYIDIYVQMVYEQTKLYLDVIL